MSDLLAQLVADAAERTAAAVRVRRRVVRVLRCRGRGGAVEVAADRGRATNDAAGGLRFGSSSTAKGWQAKLAR